MEALGNAGRYELIRPLGAGGMGEVFVARDRRLGRDVAIKRVLTPDDPSAQKRMLHEARALARLNHPHIASVFDIVEVGDSINIVMELVEGQTLSHKLHSGPSAESEVVTIGREAADALAYAHAQGVVHCDIKPSNLVVTPHAGLKILDFGIAQFDTATSTTQTRTTTSGVLRGTPEYMAPEVLHGAPATAASDLYSLGVTLYELASGRRPAEIPAPASSPPPQLSDVVAGISPALSSIVGRAIAPDPTRRFHTATELRTALDAVVVKRSGGAARISRSKAAALALALLLSCASLLFGVADTSRPPPRAEGRSVLGVLVFNDTGDSSNDYMSVGLTDVVISRLAGAPGLTVVPRTAVLPYVGSPTQVSKAVRELGLTHALTVGVQKTGDALLLTTGLVNGNNSSVVWSASMSGATGDLFRLQQRVADAALRALRAHGLLSTAEAGQARARPLTASEDAFDDYVNGRTMLERVDVPGNLDRAISFFERAAQRDPRFVAAHASLGEARWAKYRATRDTVWIDRARAATLEAVRIDPADPAVRFSLARLDHGTGRVDEAIAGMNMVLELQPANDDAHRFLGRIYSERREFERAIDALREAQRIRPEFPATVGMLGLAYYDGGQLTEAIASFTRLTTLQPDNGVAFQLLGLAHHAAGELDRALVAYERAIQIAPRAAAYSNIGIIHHTEGRYADAVRAYRRAIGMQPKEATTHRNLADALWMIGDRSQARDEYAAAIALALKELDVNPNHARMRALIAFCQAKLGRFDAATLAIREALRLAPDDNEVVYKQAVIEALAGRFDAAKGSLARAVALGYSPSRLAADRDLDVLRPLPQFAPLR